MRSASRTARYARLAFSPWNLPRRGRCASSVSPSERRRCISVPFSESLMSRDTIDSSRKKSGTLSSSLRSRKIRLASGRCTAEKAGMCGFMMPAFSRAIASIVWPRISVCSSSMGVRTQTSGCTRFVASSLPPMPVSITAHWHPALANMRKPRRVRSSKVVGPLPPG